MKPLPENPFVSIVTPSYNTGLYIEETLRSVQMQDYPLVEHIVLDSDSTDQTPEILARFPSVHLIRPAPATFCDKVNLGWTLARGDILAYLCADDYYLPGAITKAVQALKNNPDVALVYCNDLRVNEQSVETMRTRSRQTNFNELVQELDYIPYHTVFIRREALERVGLLHTRYPLVMDWDLWIRISKEFPILCVDDWWSAFREHPEQLSNVRRYASWSQGRKMTREHGGRFFSPLFWGYWHGKFSRAWAMISKGQFRVFHSKLRDFLGGFAGR